MSETREPYRCTCPEASSEEEEIEQALACSRREQEHEAEARRPAGRKDQP